MLPKLEELVLLAIYRNGPDATAGDVQAAISDAMNKDQSFGSIFTTLERLTLKKLVKWKKGQPDERRGGRAPRLYELTPRGQHELKSSLRALQTLSGHSEVGDLPIPEGVTT